MFQDKSKMKIFFLKAILVKQVEDKHTLQALCPPVVSVQMFPGWMVLPKVKAHSSLEMHGM